MQPTIVLFIIINNLLRMTDLFSNICMCYKKHINGSCFIFLQNNVKNASHTVDGTCTDTFEHSDDETDPLDDVILASSKKNLKLTLKDFDVNNAQGGGFMFVS